MGDGTGLADALLGLDGFRVLEVVEAVTGELTVTVETMVGVAGCLSLDPPIGGRCGVG